MATITINISEHIGEFTEAELLDELIDRIENASIAFQDNDKLKLIKQILKLSIYTSEADLIKEIQKLH